jgi:hypothetical protein
VVLSSGGASHGGGHEWPATRSERMLVGSGPPARVREGLSSEAGMHACRRGPLACVRAGLAMAEARYDSVARSASAEERRGRIKKSWRVGPSIFRNNCYR